MMKDVTIRKAEENDSEEILSILSRLDLYIPDITFEDFWLAQKNGRIIGVARLADHRDFLFLTSVGVIEEERNNGVAALLLNTILKDVKRDVYLYTIIPEFFKKLGFEITKETKNIPPRESFGCKDCTLEKCVCMVKKE